MVVRDWWRPGKPDMTSVQITPLNREDCASSDAAISSLKHDTTQHVLINCRDWQPAKFRFDLLSSPDISATVPWSAANTPDVCQVNLPHEATAAMQMNRRQRDYQFW